MLTFARDVETLCVIFSWFSVAALPFCTPSGVVCFLPFFYLLFRPGKGIQHSHSVANIMTVLWSSWWCLSHDSWPHSAVKFCHCSNVAWILICFYNYYKKTVHAAVKSHDQWIWTNSGYASYVLLISYLASPLDVCVYISACAYVCVLVSIPLSTTQLLLSSSPLPAALPRWACLQQTGEVIWHQNRNSGSFWKVLLTFFFFLNVWMSWVKSRAQLQAFGMFSKAMHFCVVDKKYILVFKLQQCEVYNYGKQFFKILASTGGYFKF